MQSEPTTYHCILNGITFYARTEKEAMAWVDKNPDGIYENSLHRFKIRGCKVIVAGQPKPLIFNRTQEQIATMQGIRKLK